MTIRHIKAKIPTQTDTPEETIKTSNDMDTAADNNSEVTNIDHNPKNETSLEDTKSRLEFVSIVITLVALIITAVAKVISLGKYVYYNFDLNYYDFSISHQDFITFILVIICGAMACAYYYLTRGLFIGTVALIQLRIKKVVFQIITKILLFAFEWLLYLLLIFLASLFVKDLEIFIVLQEEIYYLVAFSSVFLLSIMMIINNFSKWRPYLIVFTVSAFALLSVFYANRYYVNAKNQTYYDIITEYNSQDEAQTYVVISQGDVYSSYRCIIQNDNNGDLEMIIIKNLHKSFPIEDTLTQKVQFIADDETPNVRYCDIETLISPDASDYTLLEEIKKQVSDT